MTDPKTPYNLFGIECGDGWKELYQPLIEVCKLLDVEITQIKEKYGTLRFYICGGPDWLHDLIDAVEASSAKVCEDCGKWDGEFLDCIAGFANVKLRNYGWLRTLCDDCAKEWNPDEFAAESKYLKPESD